MTADSRRWLTLAIVGAAFFMTVLDVAIVNVALPSIEDDLNVTETTVQWVLIAYAITFGGFLLLGGRMADLLGRKRIFLVGLTLFTVASLVCGLAGDISVLIGARAMQGIGAAIISPAALSIVTTTFREGAERNKALGIWGALGGSGAAAGVLFGGIITKYLGWQWIFYVNVPVGALVFGLTLPLRPGEPRRARPPPLRRRGRGHGHQRPRAARLRDLEGARRRLGLHAHDPAADRLGCAPRGVHRGRAAQPGAADAVPDLPDPVGARRQRGRLPARRSDLRELPRPDPLRAAGSALVRAEDGRDVPGNRRDDRDLGRRRAGADHALRAASGDRHGPARPGGLDGLVHPASRARALLAGPAAAATCSSRSGSPSRSCP